MIATPTPAANEQTKPADSPAMSSGAPEHGRDHWLDLALAIWLDDTNAPGTHSQTASDH